MHVSLLYCTHFFSYLFLFQLLQIMVGKRRSSSRGGINLRTARKEKVSFSEQLVSQPLRKRVRRSATDILLADYNANTSASQISPINISSHQPSSLTTENSPSQLPLSAL